MKTPNEVVLEVATEMMYTSMQKVTAEIICNWATRLCEAMRSSGTTKESLQVSNTAKMIKVLKSTLSRIDEDEDDPVLVRIRKETKEALSAPARNCDLYETERRAAFIDWYNETFDLKGSKYAIETCDLKHNVDGILHEYIEWLFAEVKGETK